MKIQDPKEILMGDSVKFYIDTPVIYDYLKNRHTKSTQFIENIKDNPDWKGYTSSFTSLELLDNLQSLTHMENLALKELKTLDEIVRKRHQRNLTEEELGKPVKEVGNFFKKFSRNIEVFHLEESGWNRAIKIVSTINVTAKDAIHVATALEAGCDFFITRDGDLIKNIKNLDSIIASDPGGVRGITGTYGSDVDEIGDNIEVIKGIIVDILSSGDESGLFKRCQTCDRTLDGGVCAEHGLIDGYYDYGLKVILYNGIIEYRIAFEKDDIETMFDLTLETAKEMAVDALDKSVVIDFFEKRLKSKFCIVEGKHSADEFKVVSLRFNDEIPQSEIIKLYDRLKKKSSPKYIM